MPEITVQREIPAPREAVWAVYSDHRGWTRWAGVKEVVLRRQGDPVPDGVGASRVVRSRGIAVEEEITAFDPPEHMAYRLVAGIPVKRHRGEVRLKPTEAGTLFTWNVRFDARIPFTGRLLARVVERQLGAILDRLAAHPFDGPTA